MEGLFWIFPTIAVIIVAAGAVLVWRPIRAARREARFAQARRDFHHQRERLEAKFLQLGMMNPKADSPRWTGCDFRDDVSYARNRSTGQLSAFVAVTIEMDDLDARATTAPGAVGNLRVATAEFCFDGDHWETEGRAIFNLTPTEAIHFYQRQLLGHETA